MYRNTESHCTSETNIMYVNYAPIKKILTVAVSCGVSHRRGLDPALLWLWPRLAATAPIRPLAWEPPYAAGAAQEIAKRQKKKKKNPHKLKIKSQNFKFI